eukprot:CAMPEP_0169430316 /NCGR_PEP_ID=MMETSP1042-20121227/2334_1 /TAXON_ID=464988 /ORGANISM="Hemiselmis andersenii, Strain CCMP1180" /LENGTH=162 /DNA_ID=CAMNT_0009540623 /DNA_START=126 /DNA_END=614 /DNA_ORIENTATION=-
MTANEHAFRFASAKRAFSRFSKLHFIAKVSGKTVPHAKIANEVSKEMLSRAGEQQKVATTVATPMPAVCTEPNRYAIPWTNVLKPFRASPTIPSSSLISLSLVVNQGGAVPSPSHPSSPSGRGEDAPFSGISKVLWATDSIRTGGTGGVRSPDAEGESESLM